MGDIIIIGLPLLFILSIFMYKKSKPNGNGIVPPQIVRFLLVPFLATHLVLTKIIGVFEFWIFLQRYTRKGKKSLAICSTQNPKVLKNPPPMAVAMSMDDFAITYID